MTVTRFEARCCSKEQKMAAVLGWLVAFAAISSSIAKPASYKKDPPTWPGAYTVVGVLRLPYAEIVEPFQAWLNSASKRSRIDYYGGMDSTLQWGDFLNIGANFRICPMSTETKLNVRSCFQANGTEDSPVTIQSVLPDLSQFEYVGNGTYGDAKADIWQYIYTIGHKRNKYTMYTSISDPPSPIHYEMLGFDSLLGSHYDQYELDYANYSPEAPPDEDFNIPQGLVCTGFPGPGDEEETSIVSNPMQEFLQPRGIKKIHKIFDKYHKKFSKKYKRGTKEHFKRREHFRQNLRFVNSKNRQHKGYYLAMNHLGDWSNDELKMLRGKKYTPGYNGGLPYKPDMATIKDVPDSINWVIKGAVTPVKDQAVCGSCWSFGSTGTIEGTLFLKTKNLTRLSQQNLMDCSWGEGNNACDGGEDFRSYQYIMKTGGIATEESYGQYLAQDGYCHVKDAKIGAKITGYVNVTAYDLNALKTAIAQKGPISVSIDASHKSLSFYSFGVYYEPKCGSKPEQLDHSVLAVGYGTMDGELYWMIKNSWSTHWGMNGYVLMSQKDNNCGVATAPTYVVMD